MTETTTLAPPATPTWPADWDRVLDTAIRTWGGEWTPQRVQLLFHVRYGRPIGRTPARAFLSRRAHEGVMRLQHRPNARYYTLTTSTGESS